jgi:hypothetical protein
LPDTARTRVVRLVATLSAGSAVGALSALAVRADDVATVVAVTSAVLSTLALGGVAAALYYQAQQTEISRLDVARNQRAELMQFAIDNPPLMEAWGYDSRDSSKAQLQIYSSMVLAYLAMTFEIKRITEYELRFTCELMFRNPIVAEWWNTMAREIYLRESSFVFGRRNFAQIVEEAYCRRNTPPP